MAKSTVEIQLADGVKWSTSDSNVVTGVLLGAVGQLLVSAIASIPSSKEPGYMGGVIYDLEASRAALHAQVQKR
jgi:hypothetical protein